MKTLLMILHLSFLFKAFTSEAQYALDLSLGTSRQDKAFMRVQINRAVNPQLKVAAQFRIASNRYRFIAANAINTGLSYEFSLPVTYKIQGFNDAAFFASLKTGLRFQQGDPINNETVQVNNSTALHVEPGFHVSYTINSNSRFNAGVSFPITYELNPQRLFENQATMVHLGISKGIKEYGVAFLKIMTGPAFGGSGDTQKYLWSIESGVRLVLKGKKSYPDFLFIETML